LLGKCGYIIGSKMKESNKSTKNILMIIYQLIRYNLFHTKLNH